MQTNNTSDKYVDHVMYTLVNNVTILSGNSWRDIHFEAGTMFHVSNDPECDAVFFDDYDKQSFVLMAKDTQTLVKNAVPVDTLSRYIGRSVVTNSTHTAEESHSLCSVYSENGVTYAVLADDNMQKKTVDINSIFFIENNGDMIDYESLKPHMIDMSSVSRIEDATLKMSRK